MSVPTTIISTGSAAQASLFPQTTIMTSASSTANSVATGSIISVSNSIPGAAAGCIAAVAEPPSAFPVCAVVKTDRSAQIFRDCCNGAPQVVYNGECNLYCEARNQSLLTLNDCINSGFRNSGPLNGTGPILCNRAGASYLSILPANTDNPATRSTPSHTPSAATSSGAAVRAMADGDGKVVLSLGAWATLMLLGMSGFASVLL